MFLLNISDIDIDYFCIYHEISKSEAINLLENSVVVAIFKKHISKKSILKIASTTIVSTI